ncbi:MAG: hypothetical protein EOM50_06980 [Erysipelotrichia bacterium]|nr:hypothetical protein [Erysipelotrichia bacterium]
MKKQKKILLFSIVLTLTFTMISSITKIAAESYNDWTIINGVKYFYNSLGEQIGTANAKRVIDVSEHQKVIDWATVKNDNKDQYSIDGAIIRLGYGSAYEDVQLENNLAGVRANNIPYGAYLFSYADDADGALQEAQFVEQLIVKYNLQDTDFPIYYDLENFSYSNGERIVSAPSSISAYEKVISTFINYLNSKGFYNIQIYSYTNRIKNYMNSPSILQYLGWIADYSHRCNFDNTYYQGNFGWQYSSTERISGISGNVDVSCFYDKVDTSRVPNTIKQNLYKTNLRFTNDYITGFSKSDNEVNLNLLNTLSDDNYNVIVTDNANNQINITALSYLPNDYLLKFIKKDTTNEELQEYQFIIYNKGDINNDGYISSKDYNAIKNHITHYKELSGTASFIADVNGDGYISSKDYNAIKNHITGAKRLF